jgi:hypothetical protein
MNAAKFSGLFNKFFKKSKVKIILTIPPVKCLSLPYSSTSADYSGVISEYSTIYGLPPFNTFYNNFLIF